MNTYVLLLRGINVGGKNRMPMTELKLFLEEQGCANVMTFIQSGNAILKSKLQPKTLSQKIENGLPKKFKLDSSIIKALVLTDKQLQSIVDSKPKGFGDEPEKYYSDVIFLIGISADEAMKVFKRREGVDKVWKGDLAIYSQRLGAERTKSRLSQIVGTPAYKLMTIRNWNTTTKLLKILNGLESQESS